MKPFSIRQQMLALVVLLGLSLVLVGALGLRDMSRGVQALRTVYLDRVVPLKDLKAIADAYAVSIVDLSHKTRNGNVGWGEAAGRVATARAEIERLWQAYLGTYLVERERRAIAGLKPLMAEADRAIDELERILAARDQAALDRFTIERLYPVIDPVSDGFSALVAIQTDVAQETYEAAESEYQSMLMIFIGSILLVLALTIAFAWRLIRGITGSLASAAQYCADIAAGNLDGEIVIDRKDEIGELLLSLRDMAHRLREIVADVRARSAEIDRGASEISAGGLDLSRRTEEQAANLEETASSMEQMTSAVRQSAENAHDGRRLADEARQQAERGGAVVAGVVSAMADINASSERIGQIIGVVDEIAFQTNLLALNAAVEAARAGDQGRGFAVVATEVRNLAQRSAAAAKEIKSLILESVERVETGKKLVDESGSTLGTLVRSIEKVSMIVSDIAESSREQSQGIGQVHQAVEQLDRITQQNAALVEQSAAAARSLADQSRAMNDRMAFFNVGEGHAMGRAQLAYAPTAASRGRTWQIEHQSE